MTDKIKKRINASYLLHNLRHVSGEAPCVAKIMRADGQMIVSLQFFYSYSSDVSTRRPYFRGSL